MTFRIGGNAVTNANSQDYSSDLLLNNDGRQSVNSAQKKFPPPDFVTLEVRKGEDPKHLYERFLLEAARQSGLDGTPQQQKFVREFIDLPLIDPTTNKPLQSKDVKGRTIELKLRDERKAFLRELQNEYKATGGTLRLSRDGYKSPDSLNGSTVTTDKNAAKSQKVYDRANVERRVLNDLIDKAQVIPKVFGTPSKLQDLKHVTINVKPDVTATDKDRILLDYIESRYGAAQGGTLYGDSMGELLTIAKNRGVKLENITVENGKADFDISVESLLKLHHGYIGVQEKANVEKAVFEKAYKDTVAERFAKGLFEGAWEALKSNWEMVTDPIGTLKAISEAILPLANIGLKIATMPELERNILFASLAEAGLKDLAKMPLPEAAERAGQFVGALAVEAALGVGIAKGIGALGKTAVGKLIGAEAVALGKDIKQTIGKIPVPTGKVLVPVSDGLTLAMPKMETVKLGDFVQMMKSGEGKLEMLENGSTAGRTTIKETAEEGLSEVAQKGTKALKYELPKAVLAKAKEQLVTLNVARTELIAQLDGLISRGNLLPDTKNALETAKNSLTNGLKQDDLIGALRDNSGKPVRVSGSGKAFDHLQEVNQGLNSLENAKKFLTRELRSKSVGSDEFVKLSSQVDAIKEMERHINTFLEIR